MRIVTAGSNHYAYHKTINVTVANAKKFGYDVQVYDLGGLGFGEKVNDRRCESPIRQPKFSLKPELVYRNIVEGTTAWVDGDAVLIKPIDDIDRDDSFDIGLTVRPKARVKKTHYINAGVFFVKGNSDADTFMEYWIDNILPAPEDLTVKHQGFCDQETLEDKILMPVIQKPLWDHIGKVFMVHGARVKLFPCATYNNFWVWDEKRSPDPDTAILHFKGHSFRQFSRYAEEFLG
ncbi:MAG: hypothetical protein MN733_07820 [Nitrososphaera sp.]|nr:hypothetical protein [Nitrososphaera sp.]